MRLKRAPETAKRLERLKLVFAKHLKTAMTLRGVRTQFDLARASGFPEGTISKYLNAKRGLPDLEHIAQLAIGLEVRPTDLIPPDLLEQFAGALLEQQDAKKARH